MPEPLSTIGGSWSSHQKPRSALKPPVKGRPRGRLRLCRSIMLPRITDPRGNLTFLEGGRHVPFNIQRVYYVYDVPGGAERGGHAHKNLQQFIIAVNGSFDVVIDDGDDWKRVRLNRAYRGLYLAPMIWRELCNFSSGSVCLVLASAPFEEADYIREYRRFLRATKDDS